MTLYWSWKPQISQIQKPILINDVDIGKAVVSNRISFGKKKAVNVLSGTKMIKKLDLYA